jgi:hypothetical protein
VRGDPQCEVADALALLSDTAFRLYVWLCLHADRSRGVLDDGIHLTYGVKCRLPKTLGNQN